MKEDVSFSQHALTQFAKRVCVDAFDTVKHIRKVWQYATPITRERAYELTGDKEILDKRNEQSQYYEVNIGIPDILNTFGKKSNLYYERLIGVFVVRENNCVTFKTNAERDIYMNIYKYKYSKRIYDIEGLSYQ